MKNNFYYILILLLSLSIYSCKDDDVVGTGTDSPEREFMTMFRVDNNTGKGDADPYRCQVLDLNDVQLYWYGVKDCAGYEIKYALQPNVSSGLASDWENPSHILFDTIVGPDVLDLKIKDLQYSTDYRFAIRTLSKKGEGYHSKWYGYGSGRQWADYMGLTTGERYAIPDVLTAENITKTTLRLKVERELSAFGSAAIIEKNDFEKNYEVKDGNFVMQVITVEASPTNPDATVPDKWKEYRLTEDDFNRGYIDIDGLQENCVYVVNAVNKNVPVHWDAIYNTCIVRMEGTLGEPILIKHVCDPNDTIPGAVDYNACRIDTILSNYNSDASLAEGTIFELEPGKTYYCATNVSLCKGLTLRTKDDGSGRHAQVLMNGMSVFNGTVQSCNFMFGRQPQSGELGDIVIKKLIFEGIDFDCPLAVQYNGSNGTGNYFINMYSNGMPVTLQSFEIKDCTFQRMIRGFVRVQGTKRKIFSNFLVDGCLFYNCGFYDNNGRGYAWIAGDGASPQSNIYANMIFRNNTFYDSPRTSFFNDNGKNLDWLESVSYNITLENNTFVNFSTRSSGRNIFDLRYLPSGSKITVKKNLFIQTRSNGDNRNLYFQGMDIRQINGTAQEITFDIADNYSSSCESGRQALDKIFTGGAFSATKNSAGAFGKFKPGIINGTTELKIKVGATPITPTELMKSPNPPYLSPAENMHQIDNLDGLYFNKTDKVLNHEIYQLGIGDPRWRQ